MKKSLWVLGTLLLNNLAMNAQVTDPHSFSRPAEAVMKHLSLRLKADFERKVLSGSATIRYTSSASKLILDTRQLEISGVTSDGKSIPYRLGAEKPFMGQPLEIDIHPGAGSVTVAYSTRPDAAALQWLPKELTAGKSHPFLFSQSQAILARTWAPVQDSPGIRFTYDAEIEVPKGLMALMSAENPKSVSPDGKYTFRMTQPIPAYLLAIAVGDLSFHAFDGRCGVYAESVLMEKSAYEFAELPRMISAAENLYGPYAWERYDLLVLPPSFPFGGMENPRLTFATPTIIAGDRSLTSLVAHELAHSWSGNLVTNATWNDFWLNEGFTVYFENRIMEALYGRDFAEMQIQLGQMNLRETVEELGAESPDTRLKLQLEDRDPDDGMNDIAYEKGNNLLLLIEAHVGRERWDRFLRDYFERHAFGTMNTEDFLIELKNGLFRDDSAAYEGLQIEKWVYHSGLPKNCPLVASARFKAVEEQAKSWTNGTPAERLNVRQWSPFEWIQFIRSLPQGVAVERLEELNRAFHLSESKNNEVLFEWMSYCLANNFRQIYPALEDFLGEVGRRKFVKPLFQELVKTPEGLEEAKKIYSTAKNNYHPITRETVDGILSESDSRSLRIQ